MADKEDEKLKDQHQVFVNEYIKLDFNGTRAAIAAGYSEKTARVQASQLLTKLNIQQAIAKALKERSERTKVDSDWLLTHCSEMLKADIGDILDEVGQFKPIHDWPKIWRQMLSGVDIKELFAYTGGADNCKDKIGELIKAKFVSREKILELTGKHVNVGAFTEKVEHSGEVKVNILTFTESQEGDDGWSKHEELCDNRGR